jgi:hypothetical protein
MKNSSNMEPNRMPTESILQILENGKWHYIKDIPKEARINQFKVDYITKFLIKYNFVTLDEAEQKIKLNPPANRFLKKVRKLETETTSNPNLTKY